MFLIDASFYVALFVAVVFWGVGTITRKARFLGEAALIVLATSAFRIWVDGTTLGLIPVGMCCLVAGGMTVVSQVVLRFVGKDNERLLLYGFLLAVYGFLALVAI